MALLSTLLATAVLATATPAPTVLPPCCQATYGGRLLDDIGRRPDSESLEETSQWLRQRLGGASAANLETSLAAIEGFCRADTCEPRYSAARSIVKALAEQKYRDEAARGAWLIAAFTTAGTILGGVIVYALGAWRGQHRDRQSSAATPLRFSERIKTRDSHNGLR